MLSCVRFFATPWAIAHQAPLSMGLFRQEYWSRLPFPPAGDLPDPGTEPKPPVSPTLAGRFFTTNQPEPGALQNPIHQNTEVLYLTSVSLPMKLPLPESGLIISPLDNNVSLHLTFPVHLPTLNHTKALTLPWTYFQVVLCTLFFFDQECPPTPVTPPNFYSSIKKHPKDHCPEKPPFLPTDIIACFWMGLFLTQNNSKQLDTSKIVLLNN